MKQCTSNHFYPYPSKRLLSFVIQLVTDVRGYHTVVLICISLIRSDVEHLFLCLSSLGISTSIIYIYIKHTSVFLMGMKILGLSGGVLHCWGRYSLTHMLSLSSVGEITSQKASLGTELLHLRKNMMPEQPPSLKPKEIQMPLKERCGLRNSLLGIDHGRKPGLSYKQYFG